MTDARITLVTGASRGIGRALALDLCARGHHVIAVARSQKALEALDDEIKAAGGSVTLVPLDLRDGAGIDRLGEALFARFGRLDGFAANAGVLGVLAPVHNVEPSVWEEVLSLNLTANYRLLRALDPLLRQSTSGRVAFVTSGVASKVTAFWGPYAVSKAGLEMLARLYAEETEKTHIRANLFNPGPVRTHMRRKAVPGEDPAILPMPETIAAKMADMLEPGFTAHGTLVDADYRKVKT
jgi:NAD(P)-dependent dehydrogenase (short-subunit alcohol dehydrogenase family)